MNDITLPCFEPTWIAKPGPSIWLFGATSLIGFAMAKQASPGVLPIANPHNQAAATRR